MKKMLTDVMFASEKRKSMLLLLHEGPQEMETILKSLKTTRTALLPQAKILKNYSLVTQSGDVYELTTIGKLIVDETKPFLDTIAAFEHTKGYFACHETEFIPPHLLKRINEIKDCKIIEPSLINTYEINKDFIEKANESSSLSFIFTFVHPIFYQILSNFAEKNKDVHVIITEELFEKLKEDWYEEFKELIDGGKIKFYICQKHMELLSLSVSKHCFNLRLLSKTNEFSNKQLACCNPRAKQWSKDLFEYYLKDSTAITKI
ncbi:winged helix-turn-helix domain-containing protein [Methanolobus sp. ZRKC5]|uniref:helix-turn-helix transcriptional regulator n=1 Tax=unclassified Methanolobus TaxID=2629569 RepID=UPI00313C5542